MRKYKEVKQKLVVFSPDEWKKVEQRAKSVFMKTGTFIQNIAVEGEIRIIDCKAIGALQNALRSIGNNINQIARKANEINSIYQGDIENLRKEYNDICHMLNQFLYTLRSAGA
jgi:uncharacterized protein YukE